MPIIPLNLARVSNSLTTSVTTQSIASTQQQILKLENQINSGVAIATPSDNPAVSSVIMQLQKTLENRAGFASNLTAANNQLSSVDATLATMGLGIQQAISTASADVGSTTTDAQRPADANIVQTIYTQMLSSANTQYNGSYLFGGANASTPPFVEFGGGVQFVGSNQQLSNSVDQSSQIQLTVSAASVLGPVSAAMPGAANLTPAMTPTTRLADLGGASGQGIQLGTILLSSGSAIQSVDLSSAKSIGDVIDQINAAGVGGITASLNSFRNGITLSTSSGTDNITVTDPLGSHTAADLGILQTTSPGAGVSVNGTSVNPKITGTTLLSNLNAGAGIDQAGLTITNGAKSATLSFTGAQTVEDMINIVNSAGLGVTAQINSAGTGMDIVNQTSGLTMTIAENGAGTTAASLGLSTSNSTAPDSVFAHLQNLIKALQTGDQAGITAAGQSLQADYDRVVQTRGINGANLQNINSRQTTLQSQNLATQSLLTTLQATDYPTAISQYQSLQTSLQATLQTAAQTLNLSLFQFLS